MNKHGQNYYCEGCVFFLFADTCIPPTHLSPLAVSQGLSHQKKDDMNSNKRFESRGSFFFFSIYVIGFDLRASILFYPFHILKTSVVSNILKNKRILAFISNNLLSGTSVSV